MSKNCSRVANIVDPDQILGTVAFDLDLRCLLTFVPVLRVNIWYSAYPELMPHTEVDKRFFSN